MPELERDETQAITYQELYRRVNEFAALLRGFCGVQTGDRVTFHLPMVPELPVSMLACARLGRDPFGGLRGLQRRRRAEAGSPTRGSRILVTMDGYYRNGELIDHKAKADEAIAAARSLGTEVDKVLVWRRHPGQYASKSPMVDGRDFFVDELSSDYRDQLVEPVSMPAEAPLFLMYTSGTTGRPKGCQHSTGGYLSYVAGTSKYYQDIHPEDTYWCCGRHRLDHRALLHRLRPVGARDDDCDVRGRAHLSGRGSPVADRRAPRGEHLPHGSHDDPNAAQARPGRAGASTTTSSST